MKLKEITREISRHMALPTAQEQHVKIGDRNVVGVKCKDGKIYLVLEEEKDNPKKPSTVGIDLAKGSSTKTEVPPKPEPLKNPVIKPQTSNTPAKKATI